MGGAWWVVAVYLVAAAGAGIQVQEVQHRRQLAGERGEARLVGERSRARLVGERGGVRLVGERTGSWAVGRGQQLPRMQASSDGGGGAAGGESIRTLSREERRRLREERRQARMERREERRRQKHDSRRVLEAETENEAGRQEEVATSEQEVVDVTWLRANLSSLWREFRVFTTRGHLGRGHGRGHHSASIGSRGQVPAVTTNVVEEDHTCPTGVESCRGGDGQVCSSYGQCWCGHCQCEHGHYGGYCQCSDHTCQLYDGMPCGGPSRGQCRCGGCMCRAGYVGESCSCPTHTHTCFPPGQYEGEAQICSNKGNCECGRCNCQDGYKGVYCEDTVYAAGVCEKLRSCVLCQAWRRDLHRCTHCQVTLTIVDSLEPSMTTCVMVNSGCIMKYSYVAQEDNAYTVTLQRSTDCPSQIE